MNTTEILGRMLGFDEVSEVESKSWAFTAPWAEGGAWVFLGCLGLVVVSGLFYFRWQSGRRPVARICLAVFRAALLCLVLLVLAEPVLQLELVRKPKPSLWLVFDGSDSMGIEDRIVGEQREKFVKAVGAAVPQGDLPRVEWLRRLLKNPDKNLLQGLSEKYRLRVFKFDRPDGVERIEHLAKTDEGQVVKTEEGEDKVDVSRVADGLSTSGQVTAIGSALDNLARRHGKGNLAGIVLFSDFGQNSGPSPEEAAARLGVPIYTVGIGPEAVIDLSLNLQAPLLMKKAERSNIAVNLRQSGLEGQSVKVRIVASPVGGDGSPRLGSEQVIEEKEVKLTGDTTTLDIVYTPETAGRFTVSAEVETQDGEVVDQNNRAEREVTIRDDFLRLMYVEYEPTWEWRFIKEVFYRDKLVGERGFRTFLRSADPKVRHTNNLFLQTMTPPRSEFFENDVIFLGDMPASTLSTRFCEMVKEFVGKFGGGLVVISGPRFGPSQLLATPIGGMLPIVADPNARPRDEREFRAVLTADASTVPFMQLGENPQENIRGWNNLGAIPWYQPSLRPHPLATVLLSHPADVCPSDGQTRQPLIAIRRYGKGEVIYLAFNETWRMRRKYGELFYRQFWGQMIHRLGLSHALGSQKRFVVRTDRQRYKEEDRVILSIEAYNKDFEPLTEGDLPQGGLTARHVAPQGDAADAAPLLVSSLREGIFEAEVQVFGSGEHTLKVTDPITGDVSEVHFQVTSSSAERRSGKRNSVLEAKLASSTGGRTYDFDTASRIVDEIQPVPRPEVTLKVLPLWNTWPVFILVVLLMLGEWLFRKLVNLP